MHGPRAILRATVGVDVDCNTGHECVDRIVIHAEEEVSDEVSQQADYEQGADKSGYWYALQTI